MPEKKKRSKSKKKKTGLGPRRKRLAAAAICLISILVIISLLTGYQSIAGDMRLLRENGNIFSWFGSSGQDTGNPVGVFGILFGYVFIYIFGYWLALFGFIIISIISFQYFVEPERYLIRQKAYLLVIVLFLLQAVLAGAQTGYSHSIIPLFVYRALAAIFSATGARIVLIGGMILTLLLILEMRRIKQWLLVLWEDMARAKESKSQRPQIDGAPMQESRADPKPQILDHVERDIPNVKIAEPITSKSVESESKPRRVVLEGFEDDREYQMPNVEDFLESPVKLSDKDRKEIEAQILETSGILQNKLAEFNIEAEVRNVNIGPIITQYELEPAKGVKVSKFASLADDLALAIKAKSIRVQAPIPGRGLIGIEIPNLTRDMIYLKDLLLCEEMRKHKSKLAFGLGKDISGKPIVTDLARMPHLLIAGATGSGKSVCINTILMSLIMRTTPDDLRLILIDPKRVELAGYADLPHLIGNVVTDPDTALETMYWAVKEMERRYELLQEAKVREIIGYNEKFTQDMSMERLPYIVIVVDEFADLIMTSGKDIELPITRLAQMARAVGIHLILATQRPSIKVITGIIKANFPARIAFQVSSRVDSRVILDMIGAERLLGNGDMLFLPPGKAAPERIHGAYVSDPEIARVNEYMAGQPKPKQDFTLKVEDRVEGGGFVQWDDDLFPEAARVIVRSGTASVSMLQRHFKIGYARAGRLVDLLEQAQIVGPHLGSKSRDVLANREDLIRMGVINEED
ncbi:MAG: DNA translocase FtsK [Candidatus Cloacimonadales bacterium]|jgi:S-DNA-T family DNA segregation ATPase FtsK/SpoIIIE|nr:DNA translocase FtsK [Candidatus Cloacimonadota bacterium]MDY0381764.1 DNA translocase FtsK [Candidatus Cloacimonadaceae bacterium]MCB5256625.1 DNA translocase FtsK [Candidatus Cloacimonadota bacterium]MCB5263853.1 DNA translocase FtsK [Candidatus Cloacimonadota bacterium]MCB5277142.1 DNA translocase FtsK [Candidatus Cloacimonadota bacterium]